ncbi:carbon-nitrogen hydrolase family protein [Candidatus Poribacteria bacterium]|nr:carbon-nitrogen hydrolase family protein [Candidatus Poribacteria bacterium]
MSIVRVAAVQMDVRIGENTANLDKVLRLLAEAAGKGALLVVFPECALSGYCFTSLADGMPYAEDADAVAARVAERCRQLNVTAVIGFLERDGEDVRNSALLTTPDGEWHVYRKTHLPTLGIDRFVTPGDALPVFDTPVGKVGVLICYDIRFSEPVRVLGLQGADILALPTNWPEGAESSPDIITRARAWESRVYVVATNRVGVERGRRFIGRSQIVAPSGQILFEASATDETILYADLDLSSARQKRIVNEPGEWELDITGDRRPELYGLLTASPD